MSALKTWILFFGMVFLLAACSDDSSPHKVNIEELGDADSSESSGSDEGKSGGSGTPAQSGETAKPGDKIVINGGKDTIFVADAEGSLYYSSGVFCWTEGCEKNFTSSSSAAKPASSAAKPSSSAGSQPKSSASKPSSSSQASAVSVDSRAPTFDKTGMKLTDNRDGKVYEVDKINSVYWMASNLLYKPNTGYQCGATVQVETGPEGAKESVDVCDHYGVYYTYNAKDVVCPSGWRLPTKDEVNEALVSMGGDKETTEKEVKEKLVEWWVMGGRFKFDQNSSTWAFGNNGSQGHIWIQKSSANEIAIRFKDYSSWGTPEYVTVDNETEKRAYNVRCVTTN